ncbi:MAG: TetR/AcrR family transcriptional regulator [Bacteroidota bacterium]|jgi:TetR/AcrR family transcriptional repressor of multidrug resistance operon
MARIKDQHKLEQINKAACVLVLKTGFAGLKMADVAKEAGVAAGTLYVYYPTKEALINSLFKEVKSEIVQVLINPKHHSPSFYNTFQKMWLSYFNFCMKFPEKMLFVEHFFHSGLLSKQTIDFAHSIMEPVFEFIKQAQNNELIKKGDVLIIQSQISGPIHETIKLILANKIKPTKTNIHLCFEMSWQAIRK